MVLETGERVPVISFHASRVSAMTLTGQFGRAYFRRGQAYDRRTQAYDKLIL